MVFSEKSKLRSFLNAVRRRDFGLSITVSGLIQDVFEIAKDIGVEPHTVNLSLGIWGKKDLLPSENILEFTTMCGHGLVSSQLVRQYLDYVKNGKITGEKAVPKLAKPCVCGLFNPVRATHLIEREQDASRPTCKGQDCSHRP